MRIARALILCAIVVAVGVVLVSGGERGGPRTPAALPGLPPPFLGTAVTGDGRLTAAVDAYGDVVDLRPGPAGAALIDNPADRQAAGTVPSDTGIVPRVRIGGGEPMAMWEADRVGQRYLAGTNVVRTVAWFGGDRGGPAARVVMTVAASGDELALAMRGRGGDEGGVSVTPSVGVDVRAGVRCARERRVAILYLLCRSGRGARPLSGGAVGGGVGSATAGVVRAARADARRWLLGSRGLGAAAPSWARSMYARSLLTVQALTSRRTGAVAAGARDGWAYVWPRDAASAALALEASGHRAEARAVARFLTGLDLGAAARFTEAGAPVPGRAAQGDALGWVTVAARAAHTPAPARPLPWRDRADYQESSPGTYLGNALAATATDVDGRRTRRADGISAARRILGEFGTRAGLVRVAGDPGSGLDSAAGWAVRPFGLRALYPAAELTLRRLVADGTPYGITPGEGWEGGEDPWTAPTAWSAWALAALAAEGRGAPDRRAALGLLADLRRASTPAGDLPERVGVETGVPTSTTPLLWSSAFAVLALRELWPWRRAPLMGRATGGGSCGTGGCGRAARR
ncbi:MAG TPA: glycoside hydrolase family 15 protein [Solirubrobacterales bacterium]|nr:glycoside hydrolase family 15 protein [Solirubrobacterales bacterium]